MAGTYSGARAPASTLVVIRLALEDYGEIATGDDDK
jgi:hypothetical protein